MATSPMPPTASSTARCARFRTRDRRTQGFHRQEQRVEATYGAFFCRGVETKQVRSDHIDRVAAAGAAGMARWPRCEEGAPRLVQQ
jgi:hypothetical protein